MENKSKPQRMECISVKIRQRLAAVAVFLLLNSFLMLTVYAEQPETETVPDSIAEENDISAPDDPSEFSAYIEFNGQGYVVMGTFTDFTSDIVRIQPLYSLDGEYYQLYDYEWNLQWLGTEDPGELKKLQSQICLHAHREPLKSFLAEKTDRFYLKLRITKENGLFCETQAALIERGEPQPIPEGMNIMVRFAPSVLASEMRPARYYGKYQLTVCADTTAREIADFLPDMLPVEIQLHTEKNFFAAGVVECPVKWKSLSLPQLIAGESITISDVAEGITIPGGTLLSTPVGIFQLNEPVSLNTGLSSDEVELVLNVISEDRNPTGALRMGADGLEVVFDQKPVGAASIQAYTWTEKDSKWTELSDLSLLEAVSAQPSTANSGYALILHNEQEPYRSYLAAVDAGDTPEPFLVGLKIQGGVYDGRQLILPWPDTYELPPYLSEMIGSGGNEGNAGVDNRGDSTEGGQRPNLPKQSAGSGQQPVLSVESDTNSEDSSGQTDQEDPEAENTVPSSGISEVQPSQDSKMEGNEPKAASAVSEISAAAFDERIKSERNTRINGYILLCAVMVALSGIICIALGSGKTEVYKVFYRKVYKNTVRE